MYTATESTGLVKGCDGMRQGGRVFYGWVIVGVSAFVFAVVRGVHDAFGVFFVALVDEFGWSRAAIAGVFSSVQLTGAAVALGVGMLSDRISVRRLVPLGAGLIALGLILASRAQSLVMLYVAYGCIFALGYCSVGELTHVPLIARWFVTRRGTAIGVAMAGMGVGILFIVPLAQMCIQHLGWRGAYVALAVLVLLGVILPTLLWQRDRPEELGLWPDGTPPPSHSARPEATVRQPRPRLASSDGTLRSALGTPTLWLLWVMRVLTPLGMMMIVPHHVAYLVGQGFDATVAAWAYASLGVFSFLGRLGMGWLSDRLGHVPTLVLSYSFSIIGTMLLLALHDPHNLGLLWCHIVVYGTGYGGRGPLTSAMVTSLYHGKSWGAILGFLEIGAGLGGWLGPWVSGLLFDYTGSYTLSFELSMGVLGLAIIAAWCAGRQARAEADRGR